MESLKNTNYAMAHRILKVGRLSIVMRGVVKQ